MNYSKQYNISVSDLNTYNSKKHKKMIKKLIKGEIYSEKIISNSSIIISIF